MWLGLVGGDEFKMLGLVTGIGGDDFEMLGLVSGISGDAIMKRLFCCEL